MNKKNLWAAISVVVLIIVVMVALLLSNCSTTKTVKGLGAEVGQLTEAVAGIDTKVNDIKTIVDSNQTLIKESVYYAYRASKNTDTLKVRVIQCQKAIGKQRVVYRDRPAQTIKQQNIEKQTVKQQSVQQQEVAQQNANQSSVHQQSSTGGAEGTTLSNAGSGGTPTEFCIYMGSDKFLFWELVNNLGHSFDKVVNNQYGRPANMVLRPGESSNGINYDGNLVKMPVVAVGAWYREIFGSEMPSDFKPYLRGNRTGWSDRPMSKSGNYYVIRF